MEAPVHGVSKKFVAIQPADVVHHLRFLDVFETSISEDAASLFREELPNCRVLIELTRWKKP
jgi:hypothetical protein